MAGVPGSFSPGAFDFKKKKKKWLVPSGEVHHHSLRSSIRAEHLLFFNKFFDFKEASFLFFS